MLPAPARRPGTRRPIEAAQRLPPRSARVGGGCPWSSATRSERRKPFLPARTILPPRYCPWRSRAMAGGPADEGGRGSSA
eukprot:8209660-Alexandrium_andersonii.AAC.1